MILKPLKPNKDEVIVIAIMISMAIGFTLGVLAFFGTAAFLGLDFLDDDLHLEQKNGTSSRTTH